MNAPRVVGLGMATLDILTRTPKLPASNDCYAVDQIQMQGGGPVATALVALSRLGADCAYLGVQAPDDTGVQINDELRSYGIDLTRVPVRDSGVSSASVILVERSGHRAILFQKGSASDLLPEEVPDDLIASVQALHLDGFYIQAAIHAAGLAKRSGVLVSFDGGAGELWSGMGDLLPLVDMLVVARKFAFHTTGLSDPLEAGPELLQKYKPRQVVITDGERGCWYWDGQNHLYQPSYPVDVVDTTGAGDTFHGAYLYACLQPQWTPAFRLKFASAAAAMKCTRLGGRKGIPTLSQALQFLSERGEPFLSNQQIESAS
jgi:sulfofructose kinase